MKRPKGEDLVIAFAGQANGESSGYEHRFIVANPNLDCTDPPATQREIDACVVGVWDLDLSSIEQQINAKQTSGAITQLTGEATRTWTEDGKSIERLDLLYNTKQEINGQEHTTTSRHFGTVTADWSSLDGRLYLENSIATVNRNTVYAIDGVTVPVANASGAIEDISSDTLFQSVSYECTSGMLSLSPRAPRAFQMRYFR